MQCVVISVAVDRLLCQSEDRSYNYTKYVNQQWYIDFNTWHCDVTSSDNSNINYL